MPETNTSTPLGEFKRVSWSATLMAAIVGLAVAAFATWLLVQAETPNDAEPTGLFFGRFHPFILHLPIGGMAYLMCVETVRVFTAKTPARVPVLWFVTISAALAAWLGWLLGTSGDYSADHNYMEHLRWSLAFAGCTGLGLALGAMTNKVSTKLFSMGYAVALLGMVATLTIGGHRGANLTHGDGYITQHAPESIRGFLESLLGVESGPRVATAAEIAAIPMESREAYAHAVAPLLTKYCVDCHGPDLQKGSVRLDSHIALQPVFESSDPEASALSYRVLLPMDDEDHMPPAKKPQPSAAEVRILTAWILAGASESARLGDDSFQALLADTDTRDALDALASGAVMESGERATPAPDADPAERERVQALVTPIADHLGNSALIFESQSGLNLHFQAHGLTGSLTTETLQALSPVAAYITEMDMSTTGTDSELLAALPNLPNLRRMTLSSTIVGDDTMVLIAEKCPTLHGLLASNTEVSDGAIPTFAAMTSLRNLVVNTTNMTKAGLARLREQRPDLTIVE